MTAWTGPKTGVRRFLVWGSGWGSDWARTWRILYRAWRKVRAISRMVMPSRCALRIAP